MIFGAVTLGPKDSFGYTVTFTSNGVLLGHIEAVNDGYFVFYPYLQSGYWDAAVLHSLAVCLNSLNQEWDTQVQALLGEGA